ncbi:MAG: pilus assembly protein PilM [Candidatus Eisenbacteria bacterium]|uniref:Pilus assembly protein PilM n=1 Tax=Eiseniibacteriota bacterium TaxID=2212470 RepID=A0A948S0K9_UNCEI|nr:pilus assembly protein PilM [Candidatus Eisenbacteria bacterium]MBU1950626.1 pilus assembly protein PilM [Candidatus Eisenbacteria bacterium]MBU2692637.1 pilus assembly protein PilM [Candidatus Eisenbacteria bacterium]
MSVSGPVRTGIDLGHRWVKLLRGQGASTLKRITHAGVEEIDIKSSDDEIVRTAEALKRLLNRLGLNGKKLGTIAVAVRGEEANVREVALPRLSTAELRLALPFEAKKHLNLEDMISPILDFQIMGKQAPEKEGDPEEMRVLLAAAPLSQREFSLKVLSQLGLEPNVVDLEPLAGLNALLAAKSSAKTGVLGLLDLGAQHTRLYMTQADGGILTRTIGPGVPDSADADEVNGYLDRLAEQIRETQTFYRSRFRKDLGLLMVGGGGALNTGLCEKLNAKIGVDLSILDPLEGLEKSKKAEQEIAAKGPHYITACGLCRWWDHTDV